MTTSNINNQYSTNVPVLTSSTQKVSNKSKINNSAFDGNYGNTEKTKVQSKIDEILDEICAKFAKYGITKKDLKQFEIIKRALEFPDNNLENTPKQEKYKKRVIDSIETALKDSIVNGKLDIEKANKLSGDYFVALCSEWGSIDEFKKHDNKFPKDSLFDRLIAAGCLPKGATADNTSEEDIKKACHNLFFKKIAPELSNPNLSAEQKEKAIKRQIQTFGRLFINSSDIEKRLFVNIIEDLYTNNREIGLEILLSNKETSQFITEFFANNPEKMKAITTRLNPDGTKMSQADATSCYSLVASYQTESQRKIADEKYCNSVAKWEQENAEALKTIDKKIEEALAKGIKPEFTQEEKQLILERENYVRAGYAGNIIGTQQSKYLSKEFKQEHLAELNKNAYNLGDSEYRGILKSIQQAIEKRPDIITNGSADDVIKDINNATNGNYSNVISGSSTPLKAPLGTNISTGDSTDASGIGYSQTTAPNTTRLENLRNRIAPQEEENKFEIVKNNAKEEKVDKEHSNNTYKLQLTFRNSTAFEKFVANTSLSYTTVMKEAGKKYSSLTKPIQQKVLTFLEVQKNNRINLLQSINNSELTLAASKVFDIDNQDLQKLSIAGCFKDMIRKHNEQKESLKQEEATV